MKKGSTLFLRVALAIMALIVLALCIFAVPSIAKGIANEYLYISYATYPILVGIYMTAVFFYMALYQSLTLLKLIDMNKAFSEKSVLCLKNITYYGIGIAILYASAMPLIFIIAQVEDAPGMILMWGVVVMAPLVISVFAALLKKLLQNAIEAKSENDLTV